MMKCTVGPTGAMRVMLSMLLATAWLLVSDGACLADDIPAGEVAKAVLMQQVQDGRRQTLGAVDKVDNKGIFFRAVNEAKAVFVAWSLVLAIRTTEADYFPDPKNKPFRRVAHAPNPDGRYPQLIGPIDATLKLENGNQTDGIITSLFAEDVGFQPKVAQYALTYTAAQVQWVKFGDTTYARDVKSNLLQKSNPDPPIVTRPDGADKPKKLPGAEDKPTPVDANPDGGDKPRKLPGGEDKPAPDPPIAPSWPKKGVVVGQDGRQYAGNVIGLDDREVRLSGGGAAARTFAWGTVRKVMLEKGDYTFDAIAGRARFTPVAADQSQKVRLLGPLPATVTLVNGQSSSGTLISLENNELGFQLPAQNEATTFMAAQVRTIRTVDSTFIADPRTGQFTRGTTQAPTPGFGAPNCALAGCCCWIPPVGIGLIILLRFIVGRPCPKCRQWRAGVVLQKHIVGSGTKAGTVRTVNGREVERTGGENYEIIQDELRCKHCSHSWLSSRYEEVEQKGCLLILLTLPFTIWRNFSEGLHRVKRIRH